MTSTPMPDPRKTPDADYRAYWFTYMNNAGDLPAFTVPTDAPHPVPINFPDEEKFYVDMEIVEGAIGTSYFVRVPIPVLFGQPVHLYTIGYAAGDAEQNEKVRSLPLNLHAMRMLTQGARFEGAIHGPLLVVREKGICPRDTAPGMVEQNASTIIEVERDYVNHIGDAASKEAQCSVLKTVCLVWTLCRG